MITTEVSFPRMEIAVWPEAVIALKAYSDRCSIVYRESCEVEKLLTDLVKAALWRENSEIPDRNV